MRWILASLVILGACDGGGGPGPGQDTAPATDTRTDTAPDVGQGPDTVPEDITPADGVQADTPPTDGPPADGGGEPGTGCQPATRTGRFSILQDPLGSWVSGVVTDAVSVKDLALQPRETEGPCTLWMGINPAFCDPVCAAGQECGEDGLCHPEPQRLDVGTVTVEGLTVPVSLEPNFAMEYKKFDFVGPLWEDGAAITLAASGDQVEAFGLGGTGVPALEVEDTDWVVSPGEPLAVAWEPAAGPWEIWLELNVDQHGLSPVTLRCALPDTGSHTISSDMVDLLIGYGASGAASGRVHRRTLDSVPVDSGCVELEVYSRVQVFPRCVGCPCTTPGFCPEE